MYNKNICCYYIRRHIMTTTFFLYMKVYFSLYIVLYNEKYFSYIKEHIMKTNISAIHENV